MIRIDVELGTRAYPIWIGAGLLSRPEGWRTAIRGHHVLVVSNETVAPLYLDRVQQGLRDFALGALLLPEGEIHKTVASCAAVFEALADLGATRDATIIALGGGVIGDLAGFAAACWMRGIDFVQMPTTLLAMVDSSVGGKTGVNLAAGKNLVGAFHQPRAVIIDTDVLATLPPREYRSGLAEIVKIAAIGDASFFDWLQTHAAKLLARDEAVLIEAISTSVRHKVAVVARDEYEHGERALLNFGHTFGHALETQTGYGTLLHGEAIAIGMVLAARLSANLGRATHADAERLASLLGALELPIAPPECDPVRVLELMRLDKKNLGRRPRLILWSGIGHAEIVPDISEDAIRATFAAATNANG